ASNDAIVVPVAPARSDPGEPPAGSAARGPAEEAEAAEPSEAAEPPGPETAEPPQPQTPEPPQPAETPHPARPHAGRAPGRAKLARAEARLKTKLQRRGLTMLDLPGAGDQVHALHEAKRRGDYAAGNKAARALEAQADRAEITTAILRTKLDRLERALQAKTAL